MNNTHPTWDLILRNGLVMDGSGTAAKQADIAIKDQTIGLIQSQIADTAAEEVDCQGQWVMPGLLDIHTHFDLEVEISPKLEEAVRHGSTTVVVSNCSLGVCYGAQADEASGQNPVVDCFARVENIPKPVLQKVADQLDWDNSADYLEHFKRLNLGPNIVPMIPHSMLRIQVMGLEGSITRKPTAAELDEMERLLKLAVDEGYVGFSTDDLPFHYLANDPHRRSRIPTQFADFSELKRLTDVLRKHDRLWQATPPKDSPPMTLRKFLLTSGRLYGKPLKVTATAAIDLHTNSSIVKLGRLLAKLMNSWLVKGKFRLQALSAPFKIWTDGAITPLSEEIPELRELNEPDLDDRAARQKILNDPDYVERFRAMWLKGRSGFNMANLKRLLNRSDNVLSRRLEEMFVDECPVPVWNGESMQAVYDRLVRYQQGQTDQARNAEERAAFDQFPTPIVDDANFMLHLLRAYDTDFRWCTVTANRDQAVVRDLLFNPNMLPGFNDGGAHLTNLAFFDGNLLSLQIAQKEGIEQVSKMVHRLTQEPAEFFGLDAGRLAVGERADIVVINPETLQAWDWESTITKIYRDDFEHHQLVNRSSGIVLHTIINGEFAWRDGQASDTLGSKALGRAMRHKDHPAEQAYKTPSMPGLAKAA